ncbi:O-antigen ligase family protein [Flagellimonas sp.]|uniref:O-antigen ligase family protein n=1 Tax=Flagellimonas sp. TaxID=2058762 RepID=UPI003B50A773
MLLQRDFLVKNVDLNFLYLLAFSVTYAAFFSFDPKAGKQYIVIYALVPGTFYLMGKYFTERIEKRPDFVFFLLLITGITFSFSALLSVFTNILQNGYNVVDRNLPNYWTNQIVSATIMGSFLTMLMTIPSLLVSQVKKLSILYRVLLMLLYGVALACVLRIGSRTQIGISLITLLASLVYIMPRQSFRRNLMMFAIFFAGVFYIISNVSFDLDQGWLSAFAGRMEDNGAADLASGGGRTDRWLKSMEYLFEKPLGWSEHEFGHAHNLWFDVLRIGGFLSFFLLIFFTSSAYLTVWQGINKNKTAYALNNQIIIYVLAFSMVFMVEPILEGMFDFFALFCFFIGVVKKYNTDYPVIK